MSNLFIEGYSGARYDYNSAKSTEKFCNNASAVAGLAATGAVATGAYYLSKKHPMTGYKVCAKADEYVAKGLEQTYKYGKKAVNFANKNKYVKKVTDKLSDWFMKGAKKVGKTETGKNFITKALDKFVKFCELPEAKRGKYILLTAGVAALAGTAIHIIRNHDRKDGAIEQKYKDINTFSKIL